MNRISLIIGLFLAFFIFSAHAEDAKKDPFTLTTNAFLDQGAMPTLYTCDEKDVSPQLSWSNVPGKAQSFALILSDSDAPGGVFYHWVVFNIPKTETTFAEGVNKLPAGAVAGKNSFDKTQYNGPCPPKGAAHTYVFTLYALDSKLSVPAGADAKTVLAAMDKHIVGKAELTGVYSRWIK